MRFDVFTVFPNMFVGPLGESILARAQKAGLIECAIHNIRDYALDKHRTTDDIPYGGGGGMVMKVEPIVRAVREVVPDYRDPDVTVVLLSPQGQLFTQRLAKVLSRKRRIALICGRYEGVDERVSMLLGAQEISIGDYVLSGGELAAMVIIEAVSRLVPGVLGDPTATFEDSHVSGLLEYPHYTRPREFEGLAVPEVLLSGNHAEIARWRREQSLRRTFLRRPDLLDRAALSDSDRAYLRKLRQELDTFQEQE